MVGGGGYGLLCLITFACIYLCSVASVLVWRGLLLVEFAVCCVLWLLIAL